MFVKIQMILIMKTSISNNRTLRLNNSPYFSYFFFKFPFFRFLFSSFLCFVFRLSTKSSHRRCSVEKGVLRNFAKFTGKHLCRNLFFNKVAWNFILSKNTFFTEQLRTTASVTNWNIISCGICVSFKSRHVELFCKIIIQLFSTGIFLALWSRGPPCNFTEQLFFLHECLLPII